VSITLRGRTTVEIATLSNPASSNDRFPSSGRIAAVDFGTVRIGIAICDPDRILASPLEVHGAANWQEDGEYFRELAKEERIEAFIVGLPIHCDGGESQKSLECRKFASWLADETTLPVRLFDERFTTADARRRMGAGGYSRNQGKARIDAVAALVLLESFLEACRYHDQIAGEPVDSTPTGGESLDA
jgi:putative Holliday junction resolvase